jgi:hypothetical protein
MPVTTSEDSTRSTRTDTVDTADQRGPPAGTQARPVQLANADPTSDWTRMTGYLISTDPGVSGIESEITEKTLKLVPYFSLSLCIAPVTLYPSLPVLD